MTTGLVLAAAVGSVFGLVNLWLVLRFLWRVYERGGAKDLDIAAKAVREATWRRPLEGGGRVARARRWRNTSPDEPPSL